MLFFKLILSLSALWMVACSSTPSVSQVSLTSECERLKAQRAQLPLRLEQAHSIPSPRQSDAKITDLVYETSALLTGCFKSSPEISDIVLSLALSNWALVVEYDQIHDIAAENMNYLEPQQNRIRDLLRKMQKSQQISQKQAEGIWLSLAIALSLKYEGQDP